MHQAIGLNIASCKPVGGGDLPKTEDVNRRQYGKVSINYYRRHDSGNSASDGV